MSQLSPILDQNMHTVPVIARSVTESNNVRMSAFRRAAPAAECIIKHEVTRLMEARSVRGTSHAIGPKGVALKMRVLEWV